MKRIILYSELNYVSLPLLNNFIGNTLYNKLTKEFLKLDIFINLFELKLVTYNKGKHDKYLEKHLHNFTKKEVRDSYYENKQIEAIK